MSSHLGQGGIPGHIRNISEAARGHSPKAVGALAGSGGGLLTLPRDGIISNRGGEVSHVFVRGGKIIDPFTRGINQVSGWAESGSVPRVGPSVPGGCDGRYLVEGIGPTGSALGNYFSLGAGSDALDFTGDFSVCVVWVPGGTGGDLVFDGNFGASGTGWRMSEVLFDTFDAGSTFTRISYSPSPIIGSLNVVCAGRSGTNQHVKINSAALQTVAGAKNTPDATHSAKIGNGIDGGNTNPVSEIIEVWVSLMTPSDVLFTSIMLEVKGRLGVTAW